MFFLVSLASEVFDRIMSMRALYRRLGIDASVARDAPALLRHVRGSFGGRLVLLDWAGRRVLADRPIPGAAGLAVRGEQVVVCSWTEQCVHVLRGRDRVTTITHPWFNYIHSVDLTPWNTFLLASAGSDLIVEVTDSGQVVWEWFGPEHGYHLQPNGTPTFFDRQADYRTMPRSTSEQAMHVSCAILAPGDTVLATLFHQGQVVAINRRTGEATVRLNGLARPHGLHRRAGGYVVSDTLGHRIVLLDEQLNVCSAIPFGSQWLQDTIVTSAGSYLTLENVHIDQLPEPGLTNRIVEIDDSGRPVRGVEVGPENRLFTVREVNGACAGALARAWGASGGLNQWHWS
jgi:hypothetical protein